MMTKSIPVIMYEKRSRRWVLTIQSTPSYSMANHNPYIIKLIMNGGGNETWGPCEADKGTGSCPLSTFLR